MRTLAVYVASKFENSAAVREAQLAVLAEGCVVTHDWTGEDFTRAEELGLSAQEYSIRCAEADYLGACSADVVLLLANYGPGLGPMKGGLIEAGIGMASGALIFCVGGLATSIFENMPCWQHFDTLEQAIVAIRELAEGK